MSPKSRRHWSAKEKLSLLEEARRSRQKLQAARAARFAYWRSVQSSSNERSSLT